MQEHDPGRMRSRRWEFPTTPSRPPLAVNIEWRQLRDGEKRMLIEVEGIMHPYIKDAAYVGDESKNPAVLPAAYRAVEEFSQAVMEQLQHSHFAQAHRKTLRGENANPEILPSPGLLSVFVDFNPYSFNNRYQYTPLSDADMDAMFESVARRMEAAMPEVEKLVAANASLQPPENPTPQQVKGVERKLGQAWARSMRIIEREGMGRARGGSLPPPVEDN